MDGQSHSIRWLTFFYPFDLHLLDFFLLFYIILSKKTMKLYGKSIRLTDDTVLYVKFLDSLNVWASALTNTLVYRNTHESKWHTHALFVPSDVILVKLHNFILSNNSLPIFTFSFSISILVWMNRQDFHYAKVCFRFVFLYRGLSYFDFF